MFSQLRSSTSNKAREKEKERDRESENGRERERERGESESVPHSLEKSTLPRTLTYILRSIRHSVGPLGFECWAHSRTACPSGERIRRMALVSQHLTIKQFDPSGAEEALHPPSDGCSAGCGGIHDGLSLSFSLALSLSAQVGAADQASGV